MWGQILLWVATTLISAVLAPRPKRDKPRAAGLGEFEVPIASTSAPIPVCAGRVRLSAPNVVWYGDLRTRKIKQKTGGLFGSSSQTIGYRYYLGQHLVFGHASADARVTKLYVADKLAWSGAATGGASIVVDAPDLLGGDKQGGGFSGTIDVLVNPPTANAYLAARLGEVPAYRGLLGLVLRQCYTGTSPYVPAIAAEWVVLWPELDPTTVDVGAGECNPAHWIYALMREDGWGMGLPAALFDLTAWRAVATALKAEGLGVCWLWNDQARHADVVAEVLEHIDGVLYTDLRSGLITLGLIRPVADPDTLPVLDDDVVVSAEIAGAGLGEVVNAITVTWRDGSTDTDQSLTVHDLALIQAQGGIVAESVRLQGVRRGAIAARLASRELQQRVRAFTRATLTCNRLAADRIPGEAVRVVLPAEGLDLAMRIASLSYDALREDRIQLELVQDVFGLVRVTHAAPAASGWSGPIGPPQPASLQRLLDLPLGALVLQVYGIVSTALEYVPTGQGVLAALVARPGGDHLDYALRTRIGAGAWVDAETGSYAATAVLAAAVAPLDTTLSLSGLVGEFDPDLPCWGLLGEEVVWVTALSSSAATVQRAVWDTVAQSHASGERLWVIGEDAAADATPRPVGTNVEARALTRTGLGTLDIASAPAMTRTVAERAARPYPPGKLRFDGVAYPSTITGALIVTWAHRDRLTIGASVIAESAGDIGPESGTTYTLRLYSPATTLRRTVTGVTGTSYTWVDEGPDCGLSPGDLTPEVAVELESVRSGSASWQTHRWVVTRP